MSCLYFNFRFTVILNYALSFTTELQYSLGPSHLCFNHHYYKIVFFCLLTDFFAKPILKWLFASVKWLNLYFHQNFPFGPHYLIWEFKNWTKSEWVYVGSWRIKTNQAFGREKLFGTRLRIISGNTDFLEWRLQNKLPYDLSKLA